MITSTGTVWFLVGGFLVLVARIGYFRLHGYKLRVLYVRRTDVTFTAGIALITVLTLITTVTQARNQKASQNCYEQFYKALLYNAAANKRDRDYADQLDNLLTERRVSLDTLIATLGPTRVASQQSLERYTSLAADVEDRVNSVRAERMVEQSNRASYPDPSCGR